MSEDKYHPTPIYGLLPKVYNKFSDSESFGKESRRNVAIKSIKLWYGTPKKGDNKINGKGILGIECTYKDRKNNSLITETHCGDLNSNDIECKELEFKKNDDYLVGFNISFNEIITYIKLTSYYGEIIEVGEENSKITVLFNGLKGPKIIKTFNGIFNEYGLMALGIEYILVKEFIPSNVITLLRLYKFLKSNGKEKAKWENKKNLNKLPLEMVAIAKLCTSPDIIFHSIIKFCF